MGSEGTDFPMYMSEVDVFRACTTFPVARMAKGHVGLWARRCHDGTAESPGKRRFQTPQNEEDVIDETTASPWDDYEVCSWGESTFRMWIQCLPSKTS